VDPQQLPRFALKREVRALPFAVARRDGGEAPQQRLEHFVIRGRHQLYRTVLADTTQVEFASTLPQPMHCHALRTFAMPRG
jgi:hypothetical protein